ncbi:MAG: D-Ala-D-Ala carboxypeptidase family metallohydrolase [Minisyncoccia bacterium]
MNITPHFTLEELTHSDKAVELHIDNTAPPAVEENLGVLAIGLEQVRAFLGAPLDINSGYRCPELNHAVGGVADSAHLSGFAADFVSPSVGEPIDIVHKLQQSTIEWDQLIQEGTWVHISFAPTLRKQVITAHFNAEHKATYTEGA